MSPQNLYIETLRARVMVFRDGPLGKGLDHEAGALTRESTPSEEETKDSLLHLLLCAT